MGVMCKDTHAPENYMSCLPVLDHIRNGLIALLREKDDPLNRKFIGLAILSLRSGQSRIII